MPIHMENIGKTYKDLEHSLKSHNHFDKTIILILKLIP
jgi:hypothetical protein